VRHSRRLALRPSPSLSLRYQQHRRRSSFHAVKAQYLRRLTRNAPKIADVRSQKGDAHWSSSNVRLPSRCLGVLLIRHQRLRRRDHNAAHRLLLRVLPQHADLLRGTTFVRPSMTPLQGSAPVAMNDSVSPVSFVGLLAIVCFVSAAFVCSDTDVEGSQAGQTPPGFSYASATASSRPPLSDKEALSLPRS
jgi:hypothetical protein